MVPARTVSRRNLLYNGAALTLAAWLGGCADTDRPDGNDRPETQSTSLTGSIADLASAAKSEGTLNTISLPPDFANYDAIMRAYETTYGLRVVRGSPNASSAEQLETIQSLRRTNRAPDVIDVGPPFALQAVRDNLTAAYKVATWNTIPAGLKDPEGRWVGDYWGVIALGANPGIVRGTPRSWRDLLDRRYKGQVALDGDPRESGSAFAAVFAASLANGGSLDDVGPGIELFAEMKSAGTFIPVNATPATVLQGETPIMISWDYGLIALTEEYRGKIGWEVRVPSDGVFGNYYCQAINRTAAHPSAARLWQEFLYSDEGQLLWLGGYAHPARYEDMLARGVIPRQLLDRLPPAASYQAVTFPTAAQTEAARAVVQKQWASKVAGR